jgi:hypothetical protein
MIVNLFHFAQTATLIFPSVPSARGTGQYGEVPVSGSAQ